MRLLLFLLILCFPVMVHSAVPIHILGMAGECNTALDGCNPIPIAASLLCDGTGAILDCPQFAAPDYVDTTGLRFFGLTNRANPPRCVKSTNGGGTWGLCDSSTASPFTGALDVFGASFTVASDGSLIAAGDQGANNCIIRRSTDYGVSWTTVFTDSTTLNVSCGLGFANPTPSTLRCASASPYCVMIAFISGGFNLIAYYSTNYGASWSTGTQFAITTTDAEISVAVAADGNSGSLNTYQTAYNTAGRKFAYTTGGDWSVTGLIPTSAGSADGNALRCTSGSMIFGGQSVLCGPDQTATTTYRWFTHSAGSVALGASVIPDLNGFTFAQTPDFMAVGYGSSTAYVVGRNVANTQMVMWVTKDTFSTMLQIGTLTPTTTLVTGCCRGSLFVWSGKVYFTSGGSASTALFGVIQ